jgi:GDP-L-fucose synthase
VNKTNRIYIAGHLGLVGSAIHRKLLQEGYSNLLLRSIDELNLLDQGEVNQFFAQERPEFVFLAAAKVGGIHANRTYPADFIYQNLMIQCNVLESARTYAVQKLLFLGSSCIYPRMAPQPIKEEYLLTGPLEPTNEWYAIAKIAGIKMLQAYRRQYSFRSISLMSTNLYGPGDNFDLSTSHVIPGVIAKFHEAKYRHSPEVVVWGTGTPRREFLHVDDLADAALFLMLNYDQEEIINVGSGKDVTIRELCELVGKVIGYGGTIVFDASMPDGVPQKVMDVSRLISLGWQPKIPLRQGISETYLWYVANRAQTVGSRATID